MSEPNPLKAVRRVLRDKERAGISKGAGLATEARSLLIFCMRPLQMASRIPPVSENSFPSVNKKNYTSFF